MTGYAHAEHSGSWGRLSCELRSVNHRYLDLQFKLSENLRPLEPELRTRLMQHVSRGKVECVLRHAAEGATGQSFCLDAMRLSELKNAILQVQAALGAVAPADPVRVLAVPGVLRQTQEDPQPILDAARALFAGAVVDFGATRRREGEGIVEFIAARCDEIERLSVRVQGRYAEVRSQWPERLRARAAEAALEIDPSRFEQELVIALQRLDIQEELSRLVSHLGEVRAALRRQEPVGRRLDFLMQELNREANTLSSKSQDAEMTRCTVDIKVLIEQMREQVQNVE